MTTTTTVPRVALAGQVVGGERAVVAAQHPASASAGAEVLAAGGNVVDAAVAAVFGAAVGDVGRTGIGGYGGHLLYHEAATGETWAVDFPSRAPLAAHEGLFAEAAVDEPRPNDQWWRAPGTISQSGPLAAGVPAVVAGLAAAHERFGRLPWAELLAPAVRFADEGIEMGGEAKQRVFDQQPRLGRFPEVARLYFEGWEGDRLHQPELAQSLRLLATEGPRALYEGDLARRVVREVRRLGGLLDEADLASYRPSISPAVGVEYRGHEVRSTGAGSGGGVLLPTLGALRAFDLPALEPLGPERLAILLAVTGRIWSDRLALAGMLPDGNAAERLMQPEYWGRVAEQLGFSATPPTADSGSCTNHLVVADADGNTVSCTTTLRTILGCGVAVPGTGIVLNNAMGLFDEAPGRPNSVGPGKPVVTNMSPTVVLRDGRPVLATGASGGRLISSLVAQVVTLVLDHGWAPERALAAPRVHHEGGGRVLAEGGLPDATLSGLAARGFSVEQRPWASPELGGQSPAAWYASETDGRLFGAPDPRRHGAAVGV